MNQVSQVTSPDGVVYNIKDAVARSMIQSIALEAPVIVQIDSSAGNFFRSKTGTTILTATVTKNGEDITPLVTSFKWSKRDKNGNIDNSWTRIMSGNAITITADDVTNKAVFKCQVTF